MQASYKQVVAIETTRALKVTAYVLLYVAIMLLVGQYIRLTLPQEHYGLNFRQFTADSWLLLITFLTLTILINCINFRLSYWRQTWNSVAMGSILALAGIAGNMIETALTKAVTDFIPAKFFGDSWIININDILIVLGAAIFLVAAVIFIYKTMRWMFYYEIRTFMQN